MSDCKECNGTGNDGGGPSEDTMLERYVLSAIAIDSLTRENEQLRSALENARRDMLGVCPKSAAGGRRKIIKDAVARIEAVLNLSPQSGE